MAMDIWDFFNRTIDEIYPFEEAKKQQRLKHKRGMQAVREYQREYYHQHP